MRKLPVVMGTLVPHHSTLTPFFQCWEQARAVTVGGIIKASGPVLDTARNAMCSDFIDTRADWLLMVDSDMTFTPDDVVRLHQRAEAHGWWALGGLCHQVGDTVRPTLYRADEDNNPVQFTDYEPGRIVPVDFTGAAFLLVHRRVLVSIRSAYGNHWFSYTKKYGSGEDMAFCARVRDRGFDLAVDTTVDIKHLRLRGYGVADAGGAP